jgi:ABC-type nitrate/sulfonate/bicarbonate transport system permease component
VAGVCAAVLAVWEGLGRALELRTDFLPTPSRISLEIGRTWPILYEHSSVTMGEVLCALLLSAVCALPLGILLGAFMGTRSRGRLFLRSSYALPLAACAPLFLIWFGFGRISKVLLASLLCFFPMVASITQGLSSPSPDALDLMSMMGATRMQCFFKLRLPASCPFLFRGLKLAILDAVAGVIVGEFTGAEAGLGHLMLAAQSKLNTPLIFAALLLALLIPAALCGLIGGIERFLVPWSGDQATGLRGSSATEEAPAAASTIRIEKPSA